MKHPPVDVMIVLAIADFFLMLLMICVALGGQHLADVSDASEVVAADLAAAIQAREQAEADLANMTGALKTAEAKAEAMERNSQASWAAQAEGLRKLQGINQQLQTANASLLKQQDEWAHAQKGFEKERA